MESDVELQAEQTEKAAGHATKLGRRLSLGPIVMSKSSPRSRQGSGRSPNEVLVSVEIPSPMAGSRVTRRQSNRLRQIA
jgi:hypothetical protein